MNEWDDASACACGTALPYLPFYSKQSKSIKNFFSGPILEWIACAEIHCHLNGDCHGRLIDGPFFTLLSSSFYSATINFTDHIFLAEKLRNKFSWCDTHSRCCRQMYILVWWPLKATQYRTRRVQSGRTCRIFLTFHSTALFALENYNQRNFHFIKCVLGCEMDLMTDDGRQKRERVGLAKCHRAKANWSKNVTPNDAPSRANDKNLKTIKYSQRWIWPFGRTAMRARSDCKEEEKKKRNWKNAVAGDCTLMGSFE